MRFPRILFVSKTVGFSVSGSGNTVSLHLMEISWWHFWVCRSSHLYLLVLLYTLRSHPCYSTYSWFLYTFVGCYKFWSFNRSVVFLCIVMAISSILYILKHKAKFNIPLCCTLELLEHCVLFLAQTLSMKYIPGKTEDSMSPVLHLRVYREVLKRFQFFF